MQKIKQYNTNYKVYYRGAVVHQYPYTAFMLSRIAIGKMFLYNFATISYFHLN